MLDATPCAAFHFQVVWWSSDQNSMCEYQVFMKKRVYSLTQTSVVSQTMVDFSLYILYEKSALPFEIFLQFFILPLIQLIHGLLKYHLDKLTQIY